MDAVELEIRITGISERKYRASIRRAPEGLHGGVVFELPENVEEPAGGSYWRNVRRRSVPPHGSRLAALLEQGSALFELVFVQDIYAAFCRAFELARGDEAWLRLQFSFEEAPEAVEWPWEALCSQDGNPLARLRRPQVSIERRLIGLPQIQPPPRPSPGRKTALVAGASPPDLDPIDVKGEMKWIRSALKKAEIDLKLSRTEGNLDLMLAGAERFDLVHFCGHGDFEGRQGGLWLEGESGKAVRRSGRELVAYLGGPVPFVFLNCCHGGRASFEPLAGVAESLLQAGTGAVLAMRREISDQAALKLARKLYQELAIGESLVRALASARRAISTGDGEWAVPVLYLAGQDFALVAPSSPSETAGAGTPDRSLTELPEARPRAWLVAALAGLAILASILAYWFWPEPLPAPCEKPAVVSDTRCPQFPGLDLPMAFVVDPVAAPAAFCIGKFEITRGQFAAIMRLPAPRSGEAWLPQEDVSWDDGQSFAEALQNLNQQASCYLPRDAQWEFVARSGRPDELANCKGDEDGFAGVACVGSFAGNAWGLYDMTGNVWEWTQDATWKNRTSLADLPGPEKGDKRIRRGGSYLTVKENCRTINRAEVKPDRKQEAAGFRIACDPVR